MRSVTRLPSLFRPTPRWLRLSLTVAGLALGALAPPVVRAEAGPLHTLVGNNWIPSSSCTERDLPSSSDHYNALAFNDNDHLFFAQAVRVFRRSPAGRVEIVAGNGTRGFSGDGGPAIRARFGTISDLAFDADGNLFVADPENHRIRKIDTEGIVTTYAGGGPAGEEGGPNGDGGPAIQAHLGEPYELEIDAQGNLYVSDKGRVRVITPDGNIDTYVATQLPLRAVDPSGDAYFFSFEQIARWQPGGTWTFFDGLQAVSDIVVDSNGGLFASAFNPFPNNGSSRIYRVAADGTATPIAGSNCIATKGNPCGGYLWWVYHMAIDARGGIAFTTFARGEGPGIERLHQAAAPGLLAGRAFPGEGSPRLPSARCSFYVPASHTGDAQPDGQIDIRDAVLILRFISGLESYTPEQGIIADTTMDGQIDVGDVVDLLHRIVRGQT